MVTVYHVFWLGDMWIVGKMYLVIQVCCTIFGIGGRALVKNSHKYLTLHQNCSYTYLKNLSVCIVVPRSCNGWNLWSVEQEAWSCVSRR